MIVLVHFKIQNLKTFLNCLGSLNELYLSRSFHFDKELVEFLSNASEFFEQIGNVNMVSEVSRLRTYYDTALKGVNPQTLEKLKTGKRENKWIASFHVLNSISEQLQHLLAIEMQTVGEAKELIGQVILSAFQTNQIGEGDLSSNGTSKNHKHFWDKLTQNTQIKMIERKLRLSIHKEDIYILVDQVLNEIR